MNEAEDWIIAVNEALGEDRGNHPFVDEAVRAVVAERDELRRRMQEAPRFWIRPWHERYLASRRPRGGGRRVAVIDVEVSS